MADRFWQAEFPIGDPCGGPAYGQRCEPATITALAISAATAAGGAVLSSMLSPKPEKPGLPSPAPTVTETEADKQARDAQKKQRQAAAAAVGRTDTILTPPTLGSAQSTGNAATKTILGL